MVSTLKFIEEVVLKVVHCRNVVYLQCFVIPLWLIWLEMAVGILLF